MGFHFVCLLTSRPQIIWVQYLPLYFNSAWATNFGYQIMVALSTNFIGYGLAGLTRRFLVYPAYAIWCVK
jgi:hypothetical protein